MSDEWALAYSTSILHQAELIKHMLFDNGITAVIMNKQDSAYQHIGDVELYTKPDDVVKAKHLISKTEF